MQYDHFNTAPLLPEMINGIYDISSSQPTIDSSLDLQTNLSNHIQVKDEQMIIFFLILISISFTPMMMLFPKRPIHLSLQQLSNPQPLPNSPLLHNHLIQHHLMLSVNSPSVETRKQTKTAMTIGENNSNNPFITGILPI